MAPAYVRIDYFIVEDLDYTVQRGAPVVPFRCGYSVHKTPPPFPLLKFALRTAISLEDGSRPEGHMYAAGEGARDEQAPPPWRRISAAIPGPPRHDYTSSTMDREDNGRLRRSIQRQEYDGSGPPPGEDAGCSSNGYPERVGGDEVFFGGARRTTGEPERVGEYDEHGNRGAELDNRSSG